MYAVDMAKALLMVTAGTPAAIALASPTTDALKKRGLAYNDALLTQFFIGLTPNCYGLIT